MVHGGACRNLVVHHRPWFHHCNGFPAGWCYLCRHRRGTSPILRPSQHRRSTTLLRRNEGPGQRIQFLALSEQPLVFRGGGGGGGGGSGCCVGVGEVARLVFPIQGLLQERGRLVGPLQ